MTERILRLTEVVQGILRVRLLHRRVGDHRARQIGVFTGSAIILAIAWLTVPWINPASTGQQLGVCAPAIGETAWPPVMSQ